MVYEFKFPDVGEGITEGKLVSWLVQKGDVVKEDQSVAEIETDKSVVEIPSPTSGKVIELNFKEGDILKVGQIIMLLENADRQESKEEKPKEKVKEPVKEVAEKKESDLQQVLALPKVRKVAKEKGIDLSTVKGSGKDGRILLEDLEDFNTKKPIENKVKVQKHKEILASPSTRRLAREVGVDITSITGTGDHGIITKEDVKKASTTKVKHEESPQVKSIPHENLHEEKVSSDGKIREIPLSSIRKTIASRMKNSFEKTAQVTIFEEADVTDMHILRKREKDKLKDVKLTYLPFFVKATVVSLQKHPLLNSELSGEVIKIKDYYNIGIAVDTSEGLFVPVIKNADSKSIVSIAKEINLLATKAKEKKLSSKDMSEGTFTISSIGSIGGLGFTPILNSPETGILGIGRIQDKPVIQDGKIAIRKMCTLSLTFDHQVVDGAQATRFLVTLKEYLEYPNKLFLEMK